MLFLYYKTACIKGDIKMHRVLIVEDDLEQLKILKETLKIEYTDWDICTAENYENGIRLIQESLTKSLFTLFLLDIQLTKSQGDRGGFFIAKELRSLPPYYRTPILFLTAISDYGNYALSQFHCYNYISKPYTPKDILLQIEQMLFTGYLENAITIKDINRISHKIFVNEIIMVEAKNHTLIIHTLNDMYITREYTLEAFNKVLGKKFIQCHRKHIINTEFFQNYDKVSKCVHVGNLWVPVGRTHYEELEIYIK